MQDFFQNKTVLLTGGAGFIGSHLAQELIKLGATVLVVDNFVTGSEANVKAVVDQLEPEQQEDFVLIEADVNQPPEAYLPPKAKIDLVFHLASPASPPLYQRYPRLTYLVNSWATHQLLDYLLVNNPEARFLFASTSEVYGDPQVHPQPETYLGNVNPNGPRSCYDEAKRLGETICGVYFRDFNLDTRIVRIFNTYGPRMDINDGRVIPNFLKQALNQDKFTVYGDGKQTRSYCYVSDLVAGLIKMMAYDQQKGQTVNLGNPDEYTILETAQAIKQVLGQEFNLEQDVVFKKLPQDDPTKRKPDISKAKKELSWQPKVEFNEGLRRTLKFFDTAK